MAMRASRTNCDDAGLLDVAVAAEDLLRLDGAVEALVGEEALHHRGQERDEAVGGLVAGAGVGVDQGGGPEGEGAAALDEGLLVEQRAADVGVDDDRVGGAVGVRGAGTARPCRRSRA